MDTARNCKLSDAKVLYEPVNAAENNYVHLKISNEKYKNQILFHNISCISL